MKKKIPLLLLPGLMCDAEVWRPQMDALADIADPIVPNFRGLDSLTAMAEQALAMAPESFAMAGHSMGGRAALEVYRLAPERVLRLALLDTGVHPATAEEPAKRQVFLDLAQSGGIESVAEAWMPPMVHPDRVGDHTLLEELRKMITRTSVAEFRGQIRALLQRPDATPVLARIRCPTLLLCGRADAWSPPEQHGAMGLQIQDATLVIIEHAGHMITMEKPEEVSLALRQWLVGNHGIKPGKV